MFTVARTLLTLTALAGMMASTQDPPTAKTPAPARLAIGKPAPSFTLNDHTGHAVQVGGQGEKWTLLAFFPKAMTPG